MYSIVILYRNDNEKAKYVKKYDIAKNIKSEIITIDGIEQYVEEQEISEVGEISYE